MVAVMLQAMASVVCIYTYNRLAEGRGSSQQTPYQDSGTDETVQCHADENGGSERADSILTRRRPPSFVAGIIPS